MGSPNESQQTFGEWLALTPEGNILGKRSCTVNNIYKWGRRVVALAVVAAGATIVTALRQKWNWVLDGTILTVGLIVVRLALGVLAALLWRNNKKILEKLAGS